MDVRHALDPEGEPIMEFLKLPFHFVKKSRMKRRKVSTALHMLSMSGVVRPSHFEPRYFSLYRGVPSATFGKNRV